MVRHTSERGSEQHGDLAAAGPALPEFAQTGVNINRGSNQIGVRAYNERLVLALVRRHGAMARVDIARKTGLSAQTISVIIRELEKDGLITQGERVRGRVGQPSMPMRLAADGVFSFGLKIGRRSAEIILMDFLGQIRKRRHITYAWPVPDIIRTFAFDSIAEFTAALDADKRDRIAGLGIALPFELWNWVEEVGAPVADMNAWLDADLIHDFGSSLPFPVFLQNDGTAACGAELTFGRGPEFTDFVYFSIGSFIGGGVVLNNTLYPGRTGNAGALGSMPMRMREADDKREAIQLIDTASLFVLERMLHEHDISSDELWLSPESWPDFGDVLDEWIALAARGLAHAVVAAASVIDFPAAIIDGWLPQSVRLRIVEATKLELKRIDLQGLSAPEILEGRVGIHGKTMGAASLPLSHRYLFDQSVLFKERS
ncbi:ROK family transcriptional regulator [Brucella sp. H1_1004]|uniref:ROK family transcriptional regulator n=1 Tax=Brucella sp. H1_1004 TaxID=3110109 RepID=UPI0039B400E3